MSEATYTTGPLMIRRGKPNGIERSIDYAIVDSERKVIGEAFGIVDTNKTRPAMANANLWAASPDLLEACEWMLEMIEDEWGYDDTPDSRQVQARMAIAKAKGES